jgi:hypothetical protein
MNTQTHAKICMRYRIFGQRATMTGNPWDKIDFPEQTVV